MDSIKKFLLGNILIICLLNGLEAIIIKRNEDTSPYCYNNEDFPSIIENPNFTYTPNGGTGAIVYIVGDIQDVLAGRVPPGTEEKYWNAEGYVGFGAATIGSMNATGEVFYANDLAHTRSTDNASADYFQVGRSDKFRSPFSVFVIEEENGNGAATFQRSFDPSDPYSLLKFHTDLYAAMETAPYCFYGLAKFSTMEGIAVSKAPIHNEPIDDSYYSQPNFLIPNLEALIFGCAANYSTVDDPALKKKLERFLNVNIIDPIGDSELLIHSHGLGVVPCQGRNAQEEGPGGVYHFLSNSNLTEIRARVFKIDTAEKIQDLTQNGSETVTGMLSLIAVFLSLMYYY